MSSNPRDTQPYSEDDLTRGREILREIRRLTYMPNEELAIFLARVIAAERNAAALSGNENCVGLSEAKQQAPRSSIDGEKRDLPRRCYTDLYTPAETAIRNAIITVEAVGAHPLLTDSVVLLGRAQDKVADYVDGVHTTERCMNAKEMIFGPGNPLDIGASANTDRELWRERKGDYYADSIHVTADGAIGMNVGGTVIVKPIQGWHSLATKAIEEITPVALANESATQFSPLVARLREPIGTRLSSRNPQPQYDPIFDPVRIEAATVIAALSRPTPSGEGWNEAIEAAAKVAENFPARLLSMWERPGGPPGNGYVNVCGQSYIAQAIRALASPSPAGVEGEEMASTQNHAHRNAMRDGNL